MLRKESAAVRLYLERAATASEKAAAAVDPAARFFYLAMESKWMDLAASTAVVERVDLFLQSREFRLRLSPSDLCPDCRERMLLKAVQTTAELTPSNVEIVAPSIRGVFAPMTSRVDGACGRRSRPRSLTQDGGVWKWRFLTQSGHSGVRKVRKGRGPRMKVTPEKIAGRVVGLITKSSTGDITLVGQAAPWRLPAPACRNLR
jgi:hypothetical protein